MTGLGPSADDLVRSPRREELDETELVRRAQLGSAAAFEQLVLRRGQQLYRYLVVRLRDESEALDALQESLTAAWQSLPTLKDRDRFWPWLVGIAAHKAADTARRHVPAAQPTLELLDRDESVLELSEALGSLPTQFREILLLRYFLQLSEEETAAALGVRVGTVKSRSARARAALAELLR
jgi:RNA polymerase sigma-70 factor (ECF subfamily)